MDPKLFALVFSSVFVAELGDKTQIATLLYASDAANSKWTVFAASAAALIVSSGLGVLAGAAVSAYADPRLVRWLAGVGFIAVGVWILFVHEAGVA